MLTWAELKKIGQSKTIALTMFIPFAGYAILFNHVINDFFLVSFEFLQSHTSIPPEPYVASQLYFVYFGLSSLGFGSICYCLFCPSSIKTYSTECEFVATELSIMTEYRARALIEILRIRCRQNNQILNELNFYDAGRPENIEQERDHWRSMLSIIWQQDTVHRMTIRILSSLLYGAGFVCLIIPSLQMFSKITCSMINLPICPSG